MRKHKLHKCENTKCDNLVINKYCSIECSNHSRNIGIYVCLICEKCNKEFVVVFGRRFMKYCSHRCAGLVTGKINGKFGGKAANMINKRNGTGIYGITKEQRIINSKKANITNKKNNTSVYSFEIQSIGGKAGWKKGNETNRINKTGAWDPNIQSMGGKAGVIKANKTNERNKTGLYDPEVQRKGQLLSRTTVIVEGKTFLARLEAVVGLCIHYQYEKLELRKNWEVCVGSKRFDFLIKKYKCFIEVHPWDRNNLSDKQYYKFRRKILDDNGYKDYNLVVIT